MPQIRLDSGQVITAPDELRGQDLLDFIDKAERMGSAPGMGTRFMSGVYEGMGRQGEMAANVLERFGFDQPAASALDFAAAMRDAPSVWQSKQHPAGVGGTIAEMGGQLFSDLPMIIGTMGAARVPLGLAGGMTGRQLLPTAEMTFRQQYPRVIGEAALGGAMLEGAAAQPGAENAFVKAAEGAGTWGAGAAVLHPAFKTMGWALAKTIGKLRGKTMTPEEAAKDPAATQVLDDLQKQGELFPTGKKGPTPAEYAEAAYGEGEGGQGTFSFAQRRKRAKDPNQAEMNFVYDSSRPVKSTMEQGELPLETAEGAQGSLFPAGSRGSLVRGSSRPPLEVIEGGRDTRQLELPMDTATGRVPGTERGMLPTGEGRGVPPSGDGGGPVQGELALQTPIRVRGRQAELPLESRGTLPTTGEPSVIYSRKEGRFVNKGQRNLPGLDMETGRLPGTERTQLPTGVREPAPAPTVPGTPMETQHGLTMQLPSEILQSSILQPASAYTKARVAKIGQTVRYMGKDRKVTGYNGVDYILDDMIRASAKEIKSSGGRRGKKLEEVLPATQDLAPTMEGSIPRLNDQEVALRYGLEHPEKAEELKAMIGTGKDLAENQFIREAYQMAARDAGMLKSMKALLGDDPELGPLIKKAMGETGEVTKPQGPFEKAPQPNAVEQVEVPEKLVNDLRTLGYEDEFIANLVADHGVDGAVEFHAVKAREIAAKWAKRDAELRALTGKQVREVTEKDLSLTEGKELEKDVQDDLINLADALNDAETRALAEGRPLTEAEESELLDAAVRTGIEPIQKAAAEVAPKSRRIGDLLKDRLETMRARGVVESVPVTVTKTGKVKEKKVPSEKELRDEEILRLIEEQEEDLRSSGGGGSRKLGYGPDKEGWGEEGNVSVKLLAALAGIGTVGALSPYVYYKVRDFVERQQKRADELRKQLGSAELPEPQLAGISGAGLSALKDSVMRVLEKTGGFARSTNQTLEGGQEVLWKKNRSEINPMAEWFVDPSRMAERLGKDVSDWWASLMKADNISSYNWKNHATLFRDLEGTLTKEEQLRMKDILDGSVAAKSEAEKDAYGKIRNFYDEMWGKVQESRKQVYEQNLTPEEYEAFKAVFDRGVPEEKVLGAFKDKEQQEVMKEIFEDFRKLRDKGKIEDYVTRHELGQYHLIEDGLTTEGKKYSRIVANAVSKKDAVRKAKKYFEENPDKRSLTIDSNGMVYDLATYLPRGSYYRVMGNLSRALKQDISWIEKELGYAVGDKKDMARRAVRRAFTLKPSDKFSPYLQQRKDILQGEENIFDVLPAYAMSIERKANLDPVIAQARKLMGTIDDPAGRQWMANLVEDTKGRYWTADRIVDNLMQKMNADVRPMMASRAVGKIKMGEAMLKLGYRPIASLINRLSGEGHTWVKFGTETWLEAKNFMKTDAGKDFLKSVDPYMGVSYATDASGRIKPQESVLHPLGMFQAAELPNRETALTAAYLHAQKNLGMGESAAREYAIRQNWFTQFTYNAASLPRILRSPAGRLLGQFKPYFLKEMEFIRQLSGQELARYIGFQVAMGGPRGVVMLLKSLPLLGSMAALDDMELWMNKNMGRSSRGLVGGITGMDVTAASTFQMPTRFEDWTGPFVSDLMKIKKEVIDPMAKGEGGAGKGIWKATEGIVPIARYWPELVVDRIMTPGQKDFIIKDERGREVYRLDWPDIIKEAAGAEPLESSRIRVAEGILSRRRTAENKQKQHLLDSYVKAIESGSEVPQELYDELREHNIKPASVRREMKFRRLSPLMRQKLRTELAKRRGVEDVYPILGE